MDRTVGGKHTVSAEAIPSFAMVGRFCSGKGTYADCLKKLMEGEFGIAVYKVPSFSDKISEIARELFGMEGKDRDLLRAIGNKMREIDPQVWAKYLIHDIETRGTRPFVVEGFRDSSELQAFREHFPGLIVIKIEVDENARLEAYKAEYGHYPTKDQLEDISEIGVDRMLPDIVLHNRYSKDGPGGVLSGVVRAVKEGTLPDLMRR